MKREYKKPVMQVEKFTTDVNVASDTCSWKCIIDEQTWLPKQTINCVITTSDTVFVDEDHCSGCIADKPKKASSYGLTTTTTFKDGGAFLKYFYGSGNFPSEGSAITVTPDTYIWLFNGKHGGICTTETSPGLYSFS